MAKETLGFSGALKFEFRKVFGGGGRFLVEEQARVSVSARFSQVSRRRAGE